jgi:uncharacterized protein with PQ loop repeat
MQEIIKELAGFIMVFSFMFCYVPQIVKIYQNKSSEGVSLMLVVMCIVGYIAGLVYMFMTAFGIWWFLNYAVGLIMCCILLHAWFKYKKDNEYDSY